MAEVADFLQAECDFPHEETVKERELREKRGGRVSVGKERKEGRTCKEMGKR